MMQGFLSFLHGVISSVLSLVYGQPEVDKLTSEDDQLTGKYKHRHVQALLASTDVKNDHWMAVEFAALHALLPCNAETSRWYCPRPIRPDGSSKQADDAVGDILTESRPFETVLFDSSPGGIARSFRDGLVQAGRDLSSEDMLVVALIGARPWGSSYKLSPEGQDIFSAGEFRARFENFKCKIVFIIPCGDAGHWRRPRWTVLTAAESTGEPRVFTDIYRELRGQNTISLGSSSGSIDSPRGELSAGHSIVPNVEGTHEVIDIFEWFDDLKVGDLPSCTSIHPEIASLKRLLQCIPPSNRMLPQPPPIPLTTKEMAELKSLCEKYFSLPERNWEPEMYLWDNCRAYLYGRMEDKETMWLYKQLSQRKQQNERPVRIAMALGWNDIQKLGNPADQGAPDPAALRALRKCAERSGCHVSGLLVEDIFFEWTGAADWLTKAWENAGCPAVAAEDWENANVNA